MSASSRQTSLDLASLALAYRERRTTPQEIAEIAIERISTAEDGVWISPRDPDEIRAEARELERLHPLGSRSPVFGAPFAVKDNLDVAGVRTTVACPEFAFVPGKSSGVVDRLRAAGALYVGKTNLDQFATGLVGVRSPYGIPRNPFDPARVSGGSSSGSAAAIARGHVSFSVATDTAGSGRVPAAYNNIVGLKPSRGLLTTTGLFPACRSIDCVTVLSLTCEDAREVAVISAGVDPSDPFSRPEAAQFEWRSSVGVRGLRLGLPREYDLVFSDPAAAAAFDLARRRLEEMGATFHEVDMRPFYEAGQLLYGGPWIAERLAGIEAFQRDHADAMLPVIRSILAEGRAYHATDAFRAIHRLAELRAAVRPVWDRIDALFVPTVPGHPTIAEVLADPIVSNAKLGKYTTFANLLDLAVVAVPGDFRDDGLPMGVSFIGSWGSDARLLSIASQFHQRVGGSLGATGWPLPVPPPAAPGRAPAREGFLPIAVVGAHLRGQPLNEQLTSRGGTFVRTARTSSQYRLYALPGTEPPKPGLVRVAQGQGVPIEIEVWALPVETVGGFIAGVKAPLAIGTIETDDGAALHGFICEAEAVVRAQDISSFGGWRSYLQADGA